MSTQLWWGPLLIAVGSGCGGLLRFWLTGLIHRWAGTPWPVGTFVVNVTGCLAIGLLAGLMTGSWTVREEYRDALLIGVLGGYTTFSSFGRETFGLMQAGDWTRASIYIVASVVCGLLAVWLGHVAAHYFAGPRA